MYAIIQDRGRQYKVEAGQTLEIDSLPENAGSEITFDKVLMVREGEDLVIGAPFVEKASVKALVKGTHKSAKIHVYKFKRRKNYKRKIGRRQRFTTVEILTISK